MSREPPPPARAGSLASAPERPEAIAARGGARAEGGSAQPGTAAHSEVPAPPLERPTPDPTRRLAPGARALWTIEGVLWALPVLVVAAIASVGLRETDWAPPMLVPAVWAVVAVLVTVRVAVVPQLRWRQWRYEIRESEIDLRRGAFTVRRTLVPMSRVQHVDTRRTVVSQLFGLAAVVFHTAAGSNEIPALTEAEAARIRDHIADLAAMLEDPV